MSRVSRIGYLYAGNEVFGEHASVLVYGFRYGLGKDVKPELGLGGLV